MSALEEKVAADPQKEADTSKDSEELSQCSNYDTPGKVSEADPEEAAETEHLSDYEEGVAEVEGETEAGDEHEAEDEADGDGPNVQPLDSSDEERAPDDDDQQDLDSDQESVTVDDEREEGDGQESSPSKEKKLDDDEDRRNPQYIPKRGTFYEHDDRTADDMQETPSKDSKIDSRDGKETGKDSGRKVWKDREDRWTHDRFQEMDQAPKSREELLSVYGYDIRNEEAPPKARRRRRYGRGPNKYTRSWEDEEAYSRPLSAFIVEGEVKKPARKPRVMKRGGGPGNAYRNNNASGDEESGSGSMKQEFPALSSPQDNGIGNGEERKSSQASFSSKVTGAVPGAKTVAGTFNANPKDVVAPFGSQQQKQQQRPPHQQYQGHPNQAHQGPRQGQDEDQKKGWRREQGSEAANDGPHPDRAPRGRGRGGQTRNRHEEGREPGRWADSGAQTNGQSRGGRGGPGRGYRRGGPPQGQGQGPDGRRQPRDHDEGSDGDQHGYAEDVSRDMGSLSISHPQAGPGGDYQRRPSNGNANGSNGVGERRQSMPPRMQENAGSRPKRYSSMRNRNVPETNPAPPPPVSAGYTPPAPHNYYQPGYGPAAVAGVPPGVPPGVAGVPPGVAPLYQETPAMPAASPGHQPSVNVNVQVPGHQPGHQPGPPVAVAAMPVASMPTTLPSAIPNSIQCFPVQQGVQGFIAPPAHPAHPGPPAHAARLLPPGSFIPPVAGHQGHQAAPPFVAATTPQAHVQAHVPGHVQGPLQGQYQQLAFQPYQPIAMVVSAGATEHLHSGPVTQPQPAELYQPQGGITYYSTQNQNIPRAVPQPRVKSAIPILPPPERSSNAGLMEGEHGEMQMHELQMLEDVSHSSTPPAEMVVVPTEASAAPS